MRSIERRELGRTGIFIPVIGFGTWRYAGGVTPLRVAIDHGAKFVDTAESYGSEEVVGEAIRGCRPDVFVATKVRPKNFGRVELIRAAEGSLRRLGTDYIDLYQLHWPNYAVPIEETMAAMEELVESGKIRFIGVSNFSVKELKAAQSSLCKHRIVSNQVRYSLVERTTENGLLQYCQRERVTVVAYSPLGMNFRSLREYDPEGLLPELATRYQRSEAQLALNWLLEKDAVVVIPKASTPEHVIDDCGACGWHMTKEDYDSLTKGIRYRRRGPAQILVRRWGKRIFQKFGKAI